jgi:uncharacterized protein YyaL (SSP411 family)
VAWYPWGEKALQRAAREDKPILISIGYAACHWCHVMEHESFEDPETAKLMNELFVCIKVDREERPDLDQIYMTFVQMTTGSGGWPLNVFLTPQQEPFFGGTYFPPNELYGRPSWKKVLQYVSDFYNKEKDALNKNLEMIREAFKQNLNDQVGASLPDDQILIQAITNLTKSYDPIHGGLGRAPKFPAVQALALFLRQYKSVKDQKYLNVVTTSLQKMARGGIYDQIGGGFARYSVDDKWLVPHFEKMLYDNAQLLPLYLDTYLVTRDDFYLRVVRETLEFVMREMLSSEGGFYSSLDADSEGEEGKYYVWQKDEIDAALGSNSPVFCDYYDITNIGNFEGKNILHINSDIESTAKRFDMSIAQVTKILSQSRETILNIRAQRIRPGLDDKVLTSWNSLMLSAFARTYQVLREERYKQIIVNNINFLREKLYHKGKLHRTYNKGESKIAAYLDDYAFLIQALLDAYEALFDPSYLEWAHELLKYVNEKFWDTKSHGYFYTSIDQEQLIYRMKDDHDQSIPSGNAVMLLNNLRFFSLTENGELVKLSEQILKKYAPQMRSNSYAYASYLIGLDFYLKKPTEILLLLNNAAAAEQFFDSIFNHYLPNKIVIVLQIPRRSPILSASLIQGKEPIGGKTTAYVCHNFSCSQPVFTAADLTGIIQ